MYHYVRDYTSSSFPLIKGIDVKEFINQISYLKRYYKIITMEEMLLAIEGKYTLPGKAVLLTFDDAYIDHYEYVLPVLLENGIQGSFFPPAKAILEHTVLDVNKIHHILASSSQMKTIVKDIFEILDKLRNDFKLASNSYYYNKLAHGNRFDSGAVIFIKRLLQRELNEDLRKLILDELFTRYVGISEHEFSTQLYMSFDQISTLKNQGMHVGSHGYDHYWLDSLSKQDQLCEIDSSLEFLKNVGVDTTHWTMCYPYGAYNEDTLIVLKEKGCKLGLTTNVGVADIEHEHRFEYSRLDTNDFPRIPNAKLNKWYEAG